ncbi:MAG: hypothetical protein C4558_02290 [Dehalococcoidia bacterium]|nr:MAG: hypothetical protein C4558_02290 [Dehalococcoidia bacterium]
MNALVAAFATKKAMTAGVIAAAVISGSISAQTAGLTTSVSGRTDAGGNASATAMLDTTIEALTNLGVTIRGDSHGGATTAVEAAPAVDGSAGAEFGVGVGNRMNASVTGGTETPEAASIEADISSRAGGGPDGNTGSAARSQASVETSIDASVEANATLPAGVDVDVSGSSTGILGVSVR